MSNDILEKGKYSFDKIILGYQIYLLHRMSRHLVHHRTLKEEIDKPDFTKSRFWGLTTDAHISMFVVDWCKVFGSRNENIHWTKAIVDSQHKNEILDEFRAEVKQKTGLNNNEWGNYHREFKNIRDKYVAHKDVSYNGIVPSFDNALTVACTYDEWIRRRANIVVLSSDDLLPLSMRISEFKEDVVKVLRIYNK